MRFCTGLRYNVTPVDKAKYLLACIELDEACRLASTPKKKEECRESSKAKGGWALREHVCKKYTKKVGLIQSLKRVAELSKRGLLSTELQEKIRATRKELEQWEDWGDDDDFPQDMGSEFVLPTSTSRH